MLGSLIIYLPFYAVCTRWPGLACFFFYFPFIDKICVSRCPIHVCDRVVVIVPITASAPLSNELIDGAL
jgi:hypothetical protein